MSEKIHALHVISGLPRSGSTLLSSLLSQNPDVYASISSPLLGAMLAGAGGLLVAPLFLAEPTMGGPLGLKAFVVSVIGGFGNLYGAVIAGLLLGVVETLAAGYISSNFRDAFAFLLMVAFLFVRPQGLFGEKQSERV
jgi:branched-chain amino acid transport system permease protein